MIDSDKSDARQVLEDWSVGGDIAPVTALPSSVANDPAPSERSTALQRRRQLHEHGFECVVVEGKAPVADRWQQGAITPARVKAETAHHPEALNTGLRTGRVVGIDIDLTDPEHAAQMRVLAFEVLGPTAWERVGQKGSMLCYANAEPSRKITVSETLEKGAAGKPQRVEILGSGQQFVADGVHPDTGQPYRWTGDRNPLEHSASELPAVTPQQLHQFAERAAEQMASQGYQGAHIGGSGYRRKLMTTPDERGLPGASESALAGRPLTERQLVGYLSELDPGVDRDPWLRVVMAIRACPGIEEDRLVEITQEWSRGEYMFDGRYDDAPPDVWAKPDRNGRYGDDVVAADFWSLPPKQGGVGVGSLISASNEQRAARTRQSAPEAPVDQKRDPFHAYTADEQSAFKDPIWIIPDAIPDRSLVMLLGQPGSFKSFLALDLGLTLATGTARWGLPAGEPRDVVYVAGEGPRSIGRLRRPAWQLVRGIEDKDVRLHLVLTMPLAANDATIDAFIDSIKSQGIWPVVVVIDTLARFLLGLDENSAKDAGTAIAALERIRDELRCSVLIVHHEGKDARKGARGSSAITGGVDAVHRVVADKDTMIMAVRNIRQKDADEREKPWVFEGRPFASSLVFQPLTGEEATAALRKARKAAVPEIVRQVRETLRRLGADTDITTHVLATELVGPLGKGGDPDRHKRRVETRMGTLNSQVWRAGKPGILAAFVEWDDGRPLRSKDRRWHLPYDDDPNLDDPSIDEADDPDEGVEGLI